ncbi:hypothetical protein EB837_13945 [Kluyvera ascorbata]|uniref:Uncharacterized protein n=1 Tax=Kluyvera ascorbata TaxID=51288 RepID=A0A3N2S109_9ENTR|nr:hypothetical protein EB837_13945 [Kluyvera ascorbata]
MKKAHTLPLSITCHYCCVVNIYPFRRLDVKVPQKRSGVNRKIRVKSEFSAIKMKNFHLSGKWSRLCCQRAISRT